MKKKDKNQCVPKKHAKQPGLIFKYILHRKYSLTPKKSFVRLLLFFCLDCALVFFMPPARADKTVDLGGNLDFKESSLSLSLSFPALPMANYKKDTGKTYVPRSHHSTLSIEQNGYNNVASINQASASSQAMIVQVGLENIAGILQFGNDNYADIKQFGENNYASVVQVGAGNTATIVQYGKQQFSIQQIGHNETINIVQY